MKRFITLLAVLLSSCCALATPVQMDKLELLKARQAVAWQIACEAKKFDCTPYVPPDVAFAVLEPNLFGYYYRGSHTVVINMSLMESDRGTAVMVHEMIHVLQYIETQKVYLSLREACAGEAEAFNLTYAMNQKYHLTAIDDVVVPMWADRIFGYGCLV